MLQFFVLAIEHSGANSIILEIKLEVFVCYFIFNQITKHWFNLGLYLMVKIDA